MVEQVKEVLCALGYSAADGDEALVMLCCRRVEEEIRNACALQEVPDGLREFAAWLGAAEFLNAKLTTGSLEGYEGFEYGAVESLREGDVQLSFHADAGMTPEGRLRAFIDGVRGGMKACSAYRRLRW